MPLLFRRARPDPAVLAVEHDGRRYDVAFVRRSTARRITLRVSGKTSKAVLTAPPDARLDAVQRFLEEQAGWIANRHAVRPERIPLAIGSDVPLRGVPHRVVPAASVRGATRVLRGTPDDEPRIAVGGEAASVPGRVLRFLTAEAARDLKAAVARYTAILGIPARKVTIRDTRSRWGSCSSEGSLSFSWRLILAPPFVLDYLAAHEVGHLKELNHSARFWSLVRGMCPRTDDAERWLKANGTGLHRFG